VKPTLVEAPSSPEVSFGKYANEGNDEENGEYHDVKIGAMIV